MTALIVDAGALYAQADADEPEHKAIAAARPTITLTSRCLVSRSSCADTCPTGS